MTDITEFTRKKDGMETEYNKVLRSEILIIKINGRTKESLNERYKDLHRRQEDFFEEIQNRMLKHSLEERALSEISNNWNNKEYWNE